MVASARLKMAKTKGKSRSLRAPFLEGGGSQSSRSMAPEGKRTVSESEKDV